MKATITFGMNHRLFFTILRDTLRSGPKLVSSTNKRKDYLDINGHRFADALLVTYFAYVEGAIGDDWIKRFGKKQKRELYVLRHIRDAITHFNGDLNKLRKYKKSKPGKPKDRCINVKSFVRDLNSGKVDEVQGVRIPRYISINKFGVVSLNNNSFDRLSALMTTVMKRANLIWKSH